MELFIDLNKTKKSNSKFYFGIIVILFTIISFIYGIFAANWFLIGYSIFLALTGINNLVEGRGKSANSIFGKRFIFINEDKISIKLKTLKAAQTIYWQSIVSIKYGATNIEITDKTNITILIEYSELSYKMVQQIKDSISLIGKKKNIIAI